MQQHKFLDFVCEQLDGCRMIRPLRMMGEAMVYVDEKPIILICDDTVYIKMLPCLAQFDISETAIPYKGAFKRYIIDVEDRERLHEIVKVLWDNTPISKPKKKKSK